MTDSKMKAIEALVSILNEDIREREEIPTETEGFESYVSKEEFEALSKVVEAFHNFIDVHNANVFDMMLKGKKLSENHYAKAQYTMFCDTINDAQEALAYLHNIHKCNKQVMDEMCEEQNIDIEEMSNILVEGSMFKKIKRG